MIRGRIALALLAVLAVALVPATPATAENGNGFGVTPVQLAFTDPALVRDGASEGTFRVQNRADAPVSVTVTPEGAIADWLTFDPGLELTVPAQSSAPLRVLVHVPADAANGEYDGYVRLTATGTGSPDGSGASMNVELVPVVRVRVTGDEVVRFGAEDLRVEHAAADAPLAFLVDAFNRGNVRAAPEGTLTIADVDGRVVLEEAVSGAVIEPGQRATQTLRTEGVLDVGEYEATFTLANAMNGQEPLVHVFEVVPFTLANAGPAAGTLEHVIVEDATRPGGVVGVTATFTNTGLAPITSAKLTAEIMRDGERVGVVTSDPLRVAAGETVDLVAYYQTTEPGAFTASTYVVFDGVRSDAVDAPFTVHGTAGADDASGGFLGIPGLPAVLVLAVGAFVALAARRD